MSDKSVLLSTNAEYLVDSNANETPDVRQNGNAKKKFKSNSM